MRVANWNPTKDDDRIMAASMERLVKVAEIIADKARSKVAVGTVSRPVAKTGKYAGKAWTAREIGALKKTIRVVVKHDKNIRNVRVYAGNHVVFYARHVERGTAKKAARPFLRPAVQQSKAEAKQILLYG